MTDLPHKLITEQLVRAFQNGEDRESFSQIYDLYADRVYRRCLSYLQTTDDADDATQEVWIKVFFSLHTFQARSSFSTWIFRITSNHCINLLKARRLFISIDVLQELGRDVPDQKNLLTTLELRSQVTYLLSGLSKSVRALLLMKYQDRYTYAEIATVTGLGQSAIKMRLARAKRQVREMLSQHTT
jgi:RNA polymerase sigma factor (sigma-70 family)